MRAALPVESKASRSVAAFLAVFLPRGGAGAAPAVPPVSDRVSPAAGADAAGTEPSSSDSRVERPEPYSNVEEALLAGESSYIQQPLTPDKEDALQAATVANLRAALMSKNSLLSLKADMLSEDSSLLFEYLPKGTHSLSRKLAFFYFFPVFFIF